MVLRNRLLIISFSLLVAGGIVGVSSAFGPRLRAAGPAEVPSVRWAGSVDIPGSGRVNILHAPDNRTTPVAPALTVSDFGPAMAYPGLARLIARVPESDLARADVIAFEGNGGGGAGVEGGWESGIWTFSDGVSTRRVTFNECLGARRSDPSVIATGSITGRAYSAFFGMCASDPKDQVMSYILFDLHSTGRAIDATRGGFSIRLENFHSGPPTVTDCAPGHSGEGSPDPDAVGVISRCRRE